MARDDVFQVRHSSLPAISEAAGERGIINRIGAQVVVDFWTQLALSGLTFHVQAGAENAPVTATAAIDDALAFILVDNNAGYCMIPLLYEATPSVISTATLVKAMLEVDKGKARYSSGGTAFTAANLNSQSSAGAFSGVAYVSGASDVVAAAKSAVPLSVELAHRQFFEDALADTIGYPGAHVNEIYNVKNRPMAVTHGASSLIGHLGSTTADVTAYAVLQFAQLTVAQLAI